MPPFVIVARSARSGKLIVDVAGLRREAAI